MSTEDTFFECPVCHMDIPSQDKYGCDKIIPLHEGGGKLCSGSNCNAKRGKKCPKCGKSFRRLERCGDIWKKKIPRHDIPKGTSGICDGSLLILIIDGTTSPLIGHKPSRVGEEIIPRKYFREPWHMPDFLRDSTGGEITDRPHLA